MPEQIFTFLNSKKQREKKMNGSTVSQDAHKVI